MVRAFDSRPVNCRAVKRCLILDGDENMPCAKLTSDALVFRPAPRRVRARWPAWVKTIVIIHDALREASEMRRRAHRRRPFQED